jgi:hypothetical protein
MMQGYMKAVKSKLIETNPERVEAFEKGAQVYAKKLVASFKDLEFVRLFPPHVVRCG